MIYIVLGDSYVIIGPVSCLHLTVFLFFFRTSELESWQGLKIEDMQGRAPWTHQFPGGADQNPYPQQALPLTRNGP